MQTAGLPKYHDISGNPVFYSTRVKGGLYVQKSALITESISGTCSSISGNASDSRVQWRRRGQGSNASTTGTLKVALTDKANDDFAEVWIKVKAVKIVPVGYDQDCDDNDPKMINIPLDPSLPPSPSFNILDLAYVQELLGTAILPAGTYSQVRLILEPNPSNGDPVNYVVLQGDTTDQDSTQNAECTTVRFES